MSASHNAHLSQHSQPAARLGCPRVGGSGAAVGGCRGQGTPPVASCPVHQWVTLPLSTHRHYFPPHTYTLAHLCTHGCRPVHRHTFTCLCIPSHRYMLMHTYQLMLIHTHMGLHSHTSAHSHTCCHFALAHTGMVLQPCLSTQCPQGEQGRGDLGTNGTAVATKPQALRELF